MMTSNHIRELFLNYFRSHAHTVVASSSLIPFQDDQTLLFTNAGMVQFKDVFLGLDNRSYVRAVSVQRCMRAGGKHNDLDNVGYTARHHTFFEMLGNFSFGDYFKEQAIQYAWDFLTNAQYLHLSPEKLWITVYKDDAESRQIWIEKIGVKPERVIACDEKDNFWSMGDTGPCGPCSEIYYDHGENIAGGLPGTPDSDGDRYVEIWNLVFMQYNRLADGTLVSLPKPSVDTGMGLERITAIMQGAHNNYETDLFKPLIQAAQQIPRHNNALPISQHFSQHSLNVLADHIRASCFLMTDGVTPSNEGRGYVLRRIIRRAIRHGYQNEISMPFFYTLVQALINTMGQAYPELKKSQVMLEQNLIQEEQQFARTLEQGMKILNDEISQLSDHELPGELAFKLYDTYGFPLDLTADIAREKNLTINRQAFEKAMEKQKKTARASHKFQTRDVNLNLLTEQCSDFIGYEKENFAFAHAKIVDIVQPDHAEISENPENPENFFVILNATPFYAESGGQVSDTGTLTGINQAFVFKVVNVTKRQKAYLHEGFLEQGDIKNLRSGEFVCAEIDLDRRKKITLNHTATHLLHAALRKILGEHVTQKGSLVTPDKLRFDFSHRAPLSVENIREIETLVNQIIRDNYPAEKNNMTPAQAIQEGALALFGEKYGETVRTLKLGDFSHELCGGTHVNHTGDIGLFKIISETGIAAGIRRIEAVTGEQALFEIWDKENILVNMSQQLKTDPKHILQKFNLFLDQQKSDQKKLEKLTQQINHQIMINLLNHKKIYICHFNSSSNFDSDSESPKLADLAEPFEVTVIAENLGETDSKNLKNILSAVLLKIKTGIVILAYQQDSRAHVTIGVTKDLTEKYPAHKLIQPLAKIIQGKGGGRPDMAQAGGGAPENIDKALLEICHFIENNRNFNS